MRFIEDNWKNGQIGDQSFDAIARSILNIPDFRYDHEFDRDRDRDLDRKLILDDDPGEIR